MKKKVFIIIPTYNESDEVLYDVLRRVADKADHVVIVDDGSRKEVLPSVAQAGSFPLTVLRHETNLGKGVAVRNGLKKAISLGAEIVVTFDADGQHGPEYIMPMIAKIREGYDVVLGSRAFDREHMPLYNIYANRLANFFTRLFCGLRVSDSQCGFRAYGAGAFPMILQTQGCRYEYESEVVRGIRISRLAYTEVPIRAVYTAYSKNKKTKQSFFKGIKTLLYISKLPFKKVDLV